MGDAQDEVYQAVVAMSPKSCAFPKVAIVIKSIDVAAVDGTTAPPPRRPLIALLQPPPP